MLIGELARRSGVSVRMLRHYDSLGLVSPSGRTPGGYREYAATDLRRLMHVESLRSLGLPLAAVKRALDDDGFSPLGLLDELRDSARRRIAADTDLLGRLDELRSAEPAGWEDAVRVVNLLNAVRSGSGARRQQAVLAHDGGIAAVPGSALAEVLLAEEDANVAGALRWALAQNPAGGVDVLAAGLTAADAGTRRRAVAALAELGGAEAQAALRGALDDGDTEVCERVAVALGSAGDAAAVPTLVRMVIDGRRDVEAAETLARLVHAGPVTADEVVAALCGAAGHGCGADTLAVTDEGSGSGDAPTAVLLRVAQAMAEVGGHASRQALGALALHQDRVVATTAEVILRQIAGGDAT
ncbi:MerR family transcriptional regulator [Tomitella fengzijianii]|uniref:MerR family DNA-binding transcriptional regulator n=1 Tax=Tomitella fengzijianii TaxID=2597660 RepID=A0A516X1R3_9ACTN|nr:MerR family transcriptional regulator [Tomitella fengzijianii]QDQ97008.1 MerR family DNA-binding transcriptional regulator [Tomitella fengzijianii]